MGSVAARACSCAVVGIGIALLLAAAASPVAHARVLGGNRVTRFTMDADAGTEGIRHCQFGERLPRGTAAVRLSLRPLGGAGPRMRVEAVAEGRRRPLATGVRRAGWRERSLTVALHPRLRRAATATLCMTAAPGPPIRILGRSGTDPLPPGEASGPRVKATYLDRLPPIPRRAAAGGAAADGLAGLLLALLRLLASERLHWPMSRFQ